MRADVRLRRTDEVKTLAGVVADVADDEVELIVLSADGRVEESTRCRGGGYARGVLEEM